MSASMKDADKTTHLKIIVVALLLAIGVSAVAIAIKENSGRETTVTSPAKSPIK